MRTREQYLADLKKMRPNIYMDGKLVGRDDPRILHASRAIQMTFALAENPEYEELLTATSHLTGKKINRFTHIHQTEDDLLKKQEMTRKLCNLTGGCIQRCMGCDMMNGLSITTFNCDQRHGTHYSENFRKFLAYFQENDLVGTGAQTDAKGDRSKRPAEQWDPDQYLHVVERRPDGVVVRGCKQHNTMAPYADEIIVVPTRAMRPDEKDWAISFAIPADTEGVHLIIREGFSPTKDGNMKAPFNNYGDLESFTIFDNVFVPNERIFLNGETEFAGELALGFALFHRHSYTGCKPGVGDLITGLTALVADYNGIQKAGHVKEKLAELASVAELVYAAGIASAVKSEKTPSGTQKPDVTFANVGRRHAGHNIFKEYNTLCDICGGLAGTLPDTVTYNDPVLGEFVKKYVTRREGVSAEDCYRAYSLSHDILSSDIGALMLIAGVHGGGSPIMEDIAIMGSYDFEGKKALAKRLAGIEEKKAPEEK